MGVIVFTEGFSFSKLFQSTHFYGESAKQTEVNRSVRVDAVRRSVFIDQNQYGLTCAETTGPVVHNASYVSGDCMLIRTRMSAERAKGALCMTMLASRSWRCAKSKSQRVAQQLDDMVRRARSIKDTLFMMMTDS